MDTQPRKHLTKHLADVKGWNVEQAIPMNRHVTEMAEKTGVNFNLNDTVVANSCNTHRLLHFAKSQNKDAEMQEALFRAYFTGG